MTWAFPGEVRHRLGQQSQRYRRIAPTVPGDLEGEPHGAGRDVLLPAFRQSVRVLLGSHREDADVTAQTLPHLNGHLPGRVVVGEGEGRLDVPGDGGCRGDDRGLFSDGGHRSHVARDCCHFVHEYGHGVLPSACCRFGCADK